LFSSFRGAGSGRGGTANKEVAVLALTQTARVTRLDRSASRGAGCRDILVTPEQINDGGVRSDQDVVVLCSPEIPPFYAVNSKRISEKVGSVRVEGFPLERIVKRPEISRHI